MYGKYEFSSEKMFKINVIDLRVRNSFKGKLKQPFLEKPKNK